MRVYLDSTEIFDLPLGLGEEGLSEVIELDLELHGYVLYYELPVTFIGDGFKYIYNKKKQSGFCSRIEIRIETDDGLTSTGFFFSTECKFDHTELTCEAEITDSTFGVFISESKDLKISPAAVLTRGGEALTAVPDEGITLYTPSTGADLATDARMFEFSASIEHIVKYLSDNQLQYSQSYFTSAFRFFLGNHFYIRNRGGVPDIQLSFRELMQGAFNLFGLWFEIDQSTSPPTFTLIQGEGNFFSAYNGITFANVRNLMEEFYPERFFSTVVVGDEDAIIERGSNYQLPTVPLVGFRDETYNASSDCTLENQLDLKSPFIIDHNKLEYMLLTAVTEYEEKPVMIYTDSALNAYKGTYAIQGNIRYYNEELLNFKVLERHDLNSDLSQQLGAEVDNFKAYKTSDTNSAIDGSLFPVNYDSTAPPGYDTSTNYNTATFRYVIPSTGSYKFKTTTEYIVNNLQTAPGGMPGSGRVEVEVNIFRRNAVGTLLQQVEVNNIVNLTPTAVSVSHEGFAQFFCEATDYIDVEITWDFLYPGANNDITFLGLYLDPNNEYKGCSFESVFVFNSGGVIDTTSLLDYKASALIFNEYPIDATTWQQLRNSPRQGVYVNNGGNNSLCWIKKIKRNRKTGESDCEFITSPLLTQL